MNYDKKYRILHNIKRDINIQIDGRQITKTVYKIQANFDFHNTKQGDFGGFVENEDNLSQIGTCWIYDRAVVCGNAVVCDNAIVSKDAIVLDNAKIEREAIVTDNTIISGEALITNDAGIYDYAHVTDFVRITEQSKILDKAVIKGKTVCIKKAVVNGDMIIDADTVDCDLSKNLKEELRLRTGLYVINNKFIAYASVEKNNQGAFYDNKKINIGRINLVDENITGFEFDSQFYKGRGFYGLSFSNGKFIKNKTNNIAHVIAEINIKDILCIKDDKVYVRKANILDIR